jgi:hypothetical protein
MRKSCARAWPGRETPYRWNREAYFVKREAQDGKRAFLSFGCEIRDTLHE